MATSRNRIPSSNRNYIASDRLTTPSNNTNHAGMQSAIGLAYIDLLLGRGLNISLAACQIKLTFTKEISPGFH